MRSIGSNTDPNDLHCQLQLIADNNSRGRVSAAAHRELTPNHSCVERTGRTVIGHCPLETEVTGSLENIFSPFERARVRNLNDSEPNDLLTVAAQIAARRHRRGISRAWKALISADLNLGHQSRRAMGIMNFSPRAPSIIYQRASHVQAESRNVIIISIISFFLVKHTRTYLSAIKSINGYILFLLATIVQK